MAEPIGTYPMPAHGWTCFHCGETFTTVGDARDHFGADPLAKPGCMIRVQYGDERGLLMELRKAQEELARYRAEDSDKDREMYAMTAAHNAALQREEEKGYARGLADGQALSFQARVQPWMMACFGAEISADRQERNHRFLEEALELVQACGATRDEAHQLVDYVFGRPVGEKRQEVGGVMVTLAALCLAHDGLDMHEAGETELARINAPDMIAKIRAKQASKPKGSPLPIAAPSQECAGNG